MKLALAALTALVLSACGGGGDEATSQQLSPFAASQTRMSKIASRSATTDELYQFFAVVLNAEPGVAYLGQLNEAANAGMTTRQIVSDYTTKSRFTDVYPISLSDLDFATKLVANVVGISATAAAKASAVNDVVSALAIPGRTRGDVIYAIFSNLAGKQSTDANWVGMSQPTKDQADVAKTYTESFRVDTLDWAKLRKMVVPLHAVKAAGSTSPTGSVANGVAIHMYQALYGMAPSNSMLIDFTAQATADPTAFARNLVAAFAKTSDTELALLVLTNLGLSATSMNSNSYAVLLDAVGQLLAGWGPAARGQIILNITNLLANLEGDATYGTVAANYNNQAAADFSYASDVTHSSPSTVGAAAQGTVTFEQLGFNSAIVSGSDGVLHMVYITGPTPDSAFGYARCASNCGVGANWTNTIIDTGAPLKGRPRLVVGTDNRLHAVYETHELSTEQTVYSSCASNCTVATNWSKSYLTSLILGSSAAYRGAPLVIDSQNRLSFVVSTLTINAKLTFLTCAANCDTLANWTTGLFRTGGNRVAMAARGTTLHAVFFNENDSLVYRTCATNCATMTNWQESVPLFIHDGNSATAIAVTAAGGVRIVYNQGTSASNQSAAIKAQDNRVLVWSCDANCLVSPGWNGTIIGNARDGENGLSMGEYGGGLVVVSTNSVDATVMVCGTNCSSGANWVSGVIDSSTAFGQAYPPQSYAGSGCSVQPPFFAAWYLDEGQVALRPDGSVAFAFGSHMLRQCASGLTTSTYLPGFGRVTFMP